jgi:hypothetical protein
MPEFTRISDLPPEQRRDATRQLAGLLEMSALLGRVLDREPAPEEKEIDEQARQLKESLDDLWN